jgi:hypothetical protein
MRKKTRTEREKRGFCFLFFARLVIATDHHRCRFNLTSLLSSKKKRIKTPRLPSGHPSLLVPESGCRSPETSKVCELGERKEERKMISTMAILLDLNNNNKNRFLFQVGTKR